jgi:hypothetical protein
MQAREPLMAFMRGEKMPKVVSAPGVVEAS